MKENKNKSKKKKKKVSFSIYDTVTLFTPNLWHRGLQKWGIEPELSPSRHCQHKPFSNTNPSQPFVRHLGGPESPLTKFDFATFFPRRLANVPWTERDKRERLKGL